MRKTLLYAVKAPDLSSEVRSLKGTRGDVMLFASYTSDAILLVKTLKAQKARLKVILGQDAMALPTAKTMNQCAPASFWSKNGRSSV